MLRAYFWAVLLTAGALTETTLANRGPERTVELAAQVLNDIMTIPVRRIPEALLADAQGIAIIPGVIKVGFVGGIRRGRGVVLVRDREGDWGLPQFVILTGGSVGWQAGIQSTDVILVFRTKKSVEGLLNGKFTLGAGASVAAGPVGRSAEAATDLPLQAEVLSYSRGRGIFAGVAIDGSAIEIDGESHQAFYGSPSNVLPMIVPESAMRLLAEVTELTGPHEVTTVPPPNDNLPTSTKVDALRNRLSADATKLNALLDRRWRDYLALPAEVVDRQGHPSASLLQASLTTFDNVAANARYRSLSQRGEFRAVHADLRSYVELLATEGVSTNKSLDLPPPPDSKQPAK